MVGQKGVRNPWLFNIMEMYPSTSSLHFLLNNSIHHLYNKETTDSHVFCQYLKQVIEFYHSKDPQIKNQVLLVCDNASIHKTKEVCQLLNISKIGLLTIKPYSPWLNPVEGYISAIKKRIRLNLEKNNKLTEALIKNWIAETSTGDPSRFVKASQKETLKVISKIEEDF